MLKLNPSFALNKHIHAKITGDGTVVSRSLHLVYVVIAFSLILDEESPTSPNGNHTIALINTTEHYDNLLEALENIVSEIESLQSITVDGLMV